VLTAVPFALWELPGIGYVSVVDAVGTLSTNRAEVGAASVPLLRSDLITDHANLLVLWDTPGSQRVVTRTPPSRSSGPPGVVRREFVDLVDGHAGADVVLARSAIVELAASFDPGWAATVDGRPVSTVMLAPAVVGVPVGPGVHRVMFTHVGYPWYPLLFAIAGVAFVGLWAATGRRRTDVAPDGEPTVPEPAP
jgi:hypothetical protein